MKKFKLYSLIAMLLAIILSLTSCAGIFGGNDISDAFIKNKIPTLSYTAKSGAHISALDGMTFEDGAYYLMCMSKTQSNGDEKYYVYNVASGEIEYQATSTADSPVSIDLYTVYADNVFIDFFIVNKSDTYYLYSANGEQITFSESDISVLSSAGLIRVDEDMYEITEEGISKAFEYSKLAEFPDGIKKYGKYYYIFDYNSVTVYDSEFNIKSKYTAPSYADDVNIILLENGNVLIQYVYLADQASDKYSFMEDGEKFNLVTEIFKVKSGKVKDIKCNYLFEDVENGYDFSMLYEMYAGMDASKFLVTGTAYAINDYRLIDEDSETLVYVKNNGKVKEINKINEENFSDVYFIAENRWIVEAGSRKYLMDNKGKIIGDVSNATVCGEYLICDNAIYSSDDLSKLFEYQNETNDYSIYRGLGSGIILVDNETDEYKLFTGSETLQTLITENDDKYIVYKNGFMYAIRDNDTVTFYNNAGTSVYSINTKNDVFAIHSDEMSYVIIYTTNSSGDYLYHKITIG